MMMLMLHKLSVIFLHLLSSSSDEFSVKGGSNGVKGRLKSSLNFWVETLAASDFVLDMIRRGYRLPFAEYPSECFLKNNRSALQHPDFVAEAIIGLLSNGCFVEHDVPPFCVNPLRPGDCKYRELIFKTEISDFFIFCQEKPFGKLFSKISLKLAREFLV